jgi:hypothetical protein
MRGYGGKWGHGHMNSYVCMNLYEENGDERGGGAEMGT